MRSPITPKVLEHLALALVRVKPTGGTSYSSKADPSVMAIHVACWNARVKQWEDTVNAICDNLIGIVPATETGKPRFDREAFKTAVGYGVYTDPTVQPYRDKTRSCQKCSPGVVLMPGEGCKCGNIKPA